MTKQELEARAIALEDLLDNSDMGYLPDAEEELCTIYKMLNQMYELENE